MYSAYSNYRSCKLPNRQQSLFTFKSLGFGSELDPGGRVADAPSRRRGPQPPGPQARTHQGLGDYDRDHSVRPSSPGELRKDML